ncbi:MAG: DUF883 family protein [Bradyrhizobium sp.]|nr:MAG: DUF883 family protein [Bradyrhizobium sp.]
MTHDKPEASAAAVAADLTQLRDDVARMKDALAELVRGETKSAGAAIRNAVGDARSQVSQAAGAAQDTALTAAADFERRIEKNPLTAVLIAAGIGLALGVMTKSRG